MKKLLLSIALLAVSIPVYANSFCRDSAHLVSKMYEYAEADYSIYETYAIFSTYHPISLHYKHQWKITHFEDVMNRYVKIAYQAHLTDEFEDAFEFRHFAYDKCLNNFK